VADSAVKIRAFDAFLTAMGLAWRSQTGFALLRPDQTSHFARQCDQGNVSSRFAISPRITFRKRR